MYLCICSSKIWPEYVSLHIFGGATRKLTSACAAQMRAETPQASFVAAGTLICCAAHGLQQRILMKLGGSVQHRCKCWALPCLTSKPQALTA